MADNIELPKGFPGSCDGNELNRVIEILSQEAVQVGIAKTPSIPVNAQRAYLASLIQIAQGEKRDRTSSKLFWFSSLISFLSLVVSGVALYVSFQASHSSVGWEDKQLKSLEIINNTIAASSSKQAKEISNELSNLRLLIDKKSIELQRGFEKNIQKISTQPTAKVLTK